MRKIILTEQQEKNVIDLYFKGYGYRYIAKELKLSEMAVARIIKEQKPRISRTRKYQLNTKYFKKIDNEHKAYWLGFIYADGRVYRRTLTFNLKKDESNLLLLKNFLKDIESNAKIKEFKQNSFGVEVEMYKLEINSKELVEDLANLGIIPNKSLILTFPNENQVPNKFLSHFIRGYFDGDGSYSIDNNNTYIMRFQGTKEFLAGVQLFFNIKIIPKHDNRKPLNKNIYSLSFGGNLQVITKGKLMYENATIYLERKFNCFQNLLKLYNENTIKQHSKYSSLLRQ